jgi:hypothetical protein
MKFYHEALWVTPVAEMVYEDLYVDYYYEKAGWERVLFRQVTSPHIETEYDVSIRRSWSRHRRAETHSTRTIS